MITSCRGSIPRAFRVAKRDWRIISGIRKFVIAVAIILIIGGIAAMVYGSINVWCNKEAAKKYIQYEELKFERILTALTEVGVGAVILSLGGMIVIRERDQKPTTSSSVYLGPGIVIGGIILISGIIYRVSIGIIC